MYHYYVRFSIYLNHKKVGEGDIDIEISQKISQMSHIKEIKGFILNKLKSLDNCEADNVLIDFYQLLRKDPD